MYTHANPSRVTCPNAGTLVVSDQIKLTIHGYIHSSSRPRKRSASPTGSPFTQSASFAATNPAGGRSLDIPRSHVTTQDSGCPKERVLLPVRVTTPGQRAELLLQQPHRQPSAQHGQGPVAPVLTQSSAQYVQQPAPQPQYVQQSWGELSPQTPVPRPAPHPQYMADGQVVREATQRAGDRRERLRRGE